MLQRLLIKIMRIIITIKRKSEEIMIIKQISKKEKAMKLLGLDKPNDTKVLTNIVGGLRLIK